MRVLNTVNNRQTDRHTHTDGTDFIPLTADSEGNDVREKSRHKHVFFTIATVLQGLQNHNPKGYPNFSPNLASGTSVVHCVYE